MATRKLLLLLTFLRLLVAHTPAQEVEPALIGDLEAFPCSEFRYITDQFIAELVKDPGSYGYVVNIGPFDKLVPLVWREELIKAQMEIRNINSSRIYFDRAESNGSVRTQLWKIFSSEARPKIENVNNSLTLAPRKEPFILIEQTFFNDSECPDANYARLFARFLEANPSARGNLVVFGKTSGEIRRREKMGLQQLVSTFKIDRKRLRIFHRFAQNDPEHPKGIEYWYLP